MDVLPLQGSNFPWKTLLLFLAKNGLVIEGYPYGILMLGERRNLAARTKGINDLSLPEKREMIAAIKSKKLTVGLVRDSRERRKSISYDWQCVCSTEVEAMGLNQAPVIIEEAPSASAADGSGKRMFKNGRTDRKGPSRLAPSAAATRVKHRKAHKVLDISPSHSSEVELLESPPPPQKTTIPQAGPSKPKDLRYLGPPMESQASPPGDGSQDDIQVDASETKKVRKRKASAEPDKRTGKKRAVDRNCYDCFFSPLYASFLFA